MYDFAFMYVYVTCGPGAQGGQNRASDTQDLETHGCWEPNQLLRKSSCALDH